MARNSTSLKSRVEGKTGVGDKHMNRQCAGNRSVTSFLREEKVERFIVQTFHSETRIAPGSVEVKRERRLGNLDSRYGSTMEQIVRQTFTKLAKLFLSSPEYLVPPIRPAVWAV
ncbi:predicted protein [Histoplasma capsulatum G186AR]|uniref:Uncharacterized protein n=1 Tax=Ajellomyces capsulatus (strain G186AR / H82 / ATCC MYA-2454 / RMSCC 2432) TaxID=447093 RepID=C0NFJ1_AJECG|nr:uncharacterized protein HCBG_01657 [Histoplasma capsulatum G186AR]EEH10012.1 predicted protein [Histoplasma capsulatum G186AR]